MSEYIRITSGRVGLSSEEDRKPKEIQVCEWISAKNALPQTYDWILVTTDSYPNPITIARYDGKKWDFLDTDNSWTYGAICGDSTMAIDIKEITHWMPLPSVDSITKDES